jgi:short-subunit dehydrogenase
MRARLARLGMRTIVITGASSGIGLTTARRAAARGARLLVSSRNEPALRDLRDELRADGAQIEYAVADVGRLEEMQALAGKAIEAFGGFDTWVNNAGAATYGKILETPIADQRQVLETNYWGVVHGSIIAVRHFRAREGGGKLINVGSVLSDFSVPEQGPYAASKHAVKAFTTALRLEIMHDKVPVSVTLIKPSAIASPYKDHARNYMDSPGRMPPPVYAPDLVADAILHAAERHVSELTVGSAGRLQALFQQLVPAVADPVYAAFGSAMQKDHPPGQRIVREGNLFKPQKDGAERSDQRFVREHSLSMVVQTHPGLAGAALALLAGTALVVIARRRV